MVEMWPVPCQLALGPGAPSITFTFTGVALKQIILPVNTEKFAT